jgi:putative ABC transport system ATP-binding protein
MNIIEVKNIRKEYPLGKTTVHALRGINLSITKGSLLGIVGPSGSGKTTLLNIIGCIGTASDGTINIGSNEVTRLNDRELTNLRLRHIGFIFQTFNLIPVLNALENVEFPLLLMNAFSTSEIRNRAEKLISDVGLESCKHHRPAELSGGQRQRVAIARALVTNPDIILADEPTANLDSQTGSSILDLMKAINSKHNTTFLFSTHDSHVLSLKDQCTSHMVSVAFFPFCRYCMTHR